MKVATYTVPKKSAFKKTVKVKKSANKANSYVKPSDFKAAAEVNYFLKRGLDLLLGGVVFLLFVVLFPFIAMGIKLSSKGPIILKQPRTGKHGHIFFSYKFRTRHLVNSGTDYLNPAIAKKGDEPVFSFGQFLRKMNLDDLPQILNVIKGEMSLVGPKPYIVDECENWSRTYNDYFYRYMLKPGITGFAQTWDYRDGTLDDDLMRKQLDFDLTYVEKNSLLFDIKIIFKTIQKMAFGATNRR